MDFPPFWVGGKTVKGKTLLLKHTQHLYSDSLWQRVLLPLHPVSPTPAPPALQQMSCPGSEPPRPWLSEDTLSLALRGEKALNTVRKELQQPWSKGDC